MSAPPPKAAAPPDEEVAPEEDAQKSREDKVVSPDGVELNKDASALRMWGFKILISHTFERVMGLVILVNFVVVIVETDNNAKDVESDDWVWYTSWGLLGTFVTELFMKLFVLRRQFWHERWNTFDFGVIAIDSFFSLLEVFGLSFVNVSMLRILRLSRLARATKVFRMFPELKLMMAGLTGAVNAIFWGSVLLFIALLVWSVLAVQFIHPLNKAVHLETNIYDGCPRCPHAFESTFQACLTFTTQIVAGDSWGRETQPIIEYAPVSAVFFLTVYISVGLAIMNLILGVVVNVATEARDRLLREEADEKLLCENESLSTLLVMCQEMDDDGNDELTFEEIREGFDANKAFRDTLADMDIGRDDLQIVWTILDSDKSGTVTSKEFVNQIYKMKNSDSQFMLAYIKFYITEIKDKLRGDLFKLGEKMNTELTHLEEEIEEEIMEEIEKLENTQQEGADVDGKTKIMEKRASKLEANIEVQANKAQIAENTARMSSPDSEVGAGSDPGHIPNVGESMQMPVDAKKGQIAPGPSRVESEVEAGADVGGILSVIGQPVPTEIRNLLFDSGSLKELLESVHFTDLDKEPQLESKFGPQLGAVNNHVEMLARLENVWQQCIVSIDDMRNFHMSLANLLENIVRRVSITIHHTVSASVTSSTSKIPGLIRHATQLSEAAQAMRQTADSI